MLKNVLDALSRMRPYISHAHQKLMPASQYADCWIQGDLYYHIVLMREETTHFYRNLQVRSLEGYMFLQLQGVRGLPGQLGRRGAGGGPAHCSRSQQRQACCAGSHSGGPCRQGRHEARR